MSWVQFPVTPPFLLMSLFSTLKSSFLAFNSNYDVFFTIEHVLMARERENKDFLAKNLVDPGGFEPLTYR